MNAPTPNPSPSSAPSSLVADPFLYREERLFCEDSDLASIAESAETPCYVYSANGIRRRFLAYREAFAAVPHRICYAMKANSNLAVLKLLAEIGAGFDIVSAGELHRVLLAGGDPALVVFSGVGKTAHEIEFALDRGIHSFNCESRGEVELLARLARKRGSRARAALRVNPEVDAQTHPYISTGLQEHKFGIQLAEALSLYQRYRDDDAIEWIGVSCHIGSQILDVSPLLEAVEKLLAFARELQSLGIPIRELDIGGGLGVAYRREETSPAIHHFVDRVLGRIRESGLTVVAEPGRSLVAESGVLLTRVLHTKQTPTRNFVIVDAAMNDLIRPSLYQAHHDIVPLRVNSGEMLLSDVVGPVCESGDFFARQRLLPPFAAGDLLAICTAGAYGFVLASNYNARTRPAEVLVEGCNWRVVRQRETWEDLVRGESV